MNDPSTNQPTLELNQGFSYVPLMLILDLWIFNVTSFRTKKKFSNKLKKNIIIFFFILRYIVDDASNLSLLGIYMSKLSTRPHDTSAT